MAHTAGSSDFLIVQYFFCICIVCNSQFEFVLILRAAVSEFTPFCPAHCNSLTGDRAFAVAGPRAWNSLPSDIRTSTPSFDTFKKHLKSYLFQLSFFQPVELVTTCTLTMLGALEVVRAACCAL